MGTTWLQDAYTQSELTLKALKLATEFLMEGGTFISKVFRSKDYNALLWVFNQLFKKVDVTKPSSSRNVSAEIYVVCTGYLAPSQLDPKLLDGKHVFSELPDQIKRIDIFHPEKRKRNREGYEEGSTILFKASPAIAFVQSPDPVLVLSSFSEFTFDDAESAALLARPETTVDVQEAVKDLKVLGRKDFKLLLKWRLQMRKLLTAQRKASGKPALEGEDEEAAPTGADVGVDQDGDDADREDRAIDEQDDLARKSKREKRRALLEKAKQRERMRLEMNVPNDTGNYISEEGLFSIRTLRTHADLNRVNDGTDEPDVDEAEKGAALAVDDGGDDDDDILDDDALEGEDADRLIRLRRMERELEGQYLEFKMRKDPKKALQSQAERRRRLDTAAVLRTNDSDDEDDHDEEQQLEGRRGGAPADHPLLRDPAASREELDAHRKTALWFSQPLFAKALGGLNHPGLNGGREDNSDDEDDLAGRAGAGADSDDEDDTIRQLNAKAHTKLKRNEHDAKKKTGKKSVKEDEDEDEEENDEDDVLSSDSAWSEDDDDDIDSDDDASSTASGDEGRIEEVAATSTGTKSSGLPLTPEQLALARVLMEKGREALVDQGFNRYATNDQDALPTWFEDEEHKFRIPSQPVTKADVELYRAKMKELDARPIKKVAEAKARKKRRAETKMERLRKKADVINESTDISEREKANSITKLMRNKEKQKDTVSVVVARGGTKGSRARPAGVKGRYKMVDARMRKDLRAAKASGAKGKGSKKKAGKGNKKPSRKPQSA